MLQTSRPKRLENATARHKEAAKASVLTPVASKPAPLKPAATKKAPATKGRKSTLPPKPKGSGWPVPTPEEKAVMDEAIRKRKLDILKKKMLKTTQAMLKLNIEQG